MCHNDQQSCFVMEERKQIEDMRLWVSFTSGSLRFIGGTCQWAALQ